MLQSWGPPGTPNRITTLYGKNGMTFLVKAKYNPNTQQIFRPLKNKLDHLEIYINQI